MNELQTQSKTINILRFFMAILVVAAHQTPMFDSSIGGFDNTLYCIASSLFCRVLPTVAVPMFFLFSGYLYFFKTEGFSRGVYVQKTKKRFRTLLMPFLLWNVIAFLLDAIWWEGVRGRSLTAVLNHLQRFSYHIFWDYHTWPRGSRCLGLLEYSDYKAPIDLPLWFLRDLIILMLLTPVVYWCIKRLRVWFVALLGIAYLLNIWPDTSILCANSLFFFCLGAWLGINQQEIEPLFRRMFRPACIIAALIVALKCYMEFTAQTTFIGLLRPFGVISLMVVTFILAYRFVKKGKVKNTKTIFIQSSFFIFVCHDIIITKYAKKISNYLCEALLPSLPGIAHCCALLLGTLMPILLCVLIYALMKRFMPTVLRVLMGNR